MVGLDVTLQARATPAVRDRLRPLGPLASELVLPGLDQYATDADPLGAADGPGPAVHDVVAMAYTASPGLLGCLPARVEVETTGRWTSGMTVTDFAAPEGERNALVATAIDVRGFWDLVLDSYHRVAVAMAALAQ
jgi:purine nucleosidase